MQNNNFVRMSIDGMRANVILNAIKSKLVQFGRQHFNANKLVARYHSKLKFLSRIGSLKCS